MERLRNKYNCNLHYHYKVSKGAKIRNRYSQVPHLTQDTNGKDLGKDDIKACHHSELNLSELVSTD